MFLDEEISSAGGWWWWLCVGGLTWRCTPSEAIGLWSVILFYTTVVVVTILHSVMIDQTDGTLVEATTRIRQQQTRTSDSSSDDDWLMLCSLLIYFFTFAAGCLVWVLGGTRWVHPIQIWQVQLLGSAILAACLFLFVAVHINLGENWSPIPEQKEGHQLVTHGIFRYARHPMYAVFLWAAISTFLATLNWVIAWCIFGSVMVTLQRIKEEELILTGLFGARYLEYRRHVSALGPPWGCLRFDGEMVTSMPTQQRRRGDYSAIE